MLAKERKQTVLRILESKGAVSVVELSERLGISEVTVRRDLSELEEQGKLKRTHGGAIRGQSSGTAYEPGIATLEQEKVEEKIAIAARAYDMISSGDAIILDSSSTAAMLCPFLKNGGKKNITVVTNSFRPVLELMNTDNVDLIHLGGQVRRNIYSTIGPLAETVLGQLRVDLAFMGINGIDLQNDILGTPNLFESNIKRAMMQAAARTVVLADSSKFGKTCLSTVSSLGQVSAIVTDDGVDASIREKAEERGIELIVCPVAKNK